MGQSWHDYSTGSTPNPRRLRGPIDLVHLAKQSLGDVGLEHEVLRMFDQIAQTYFGRLQRATTTDDVLLNLQSLKGAANGVGARGIAEMAEIAEQELRSGAPLNAERVDDLNIAVQEVSAYIEDLLRKQPQ